MNKQLKLSLKHNFTPPPPQQKGGFIDRLMYPKAKFREVVFSQIGFIRKRVWILFIFAVCFAFFYTRFLDVPENIISGVSAILPLFSLCTINEIYKSTAYNMSETELACRYNLLKISLARLAVLGSVSFMVLILFVFFVNINELGAVRNAIYLAVPYLLSSYISLLIVANTNSKEAIYVCLAVSTAVCILALTLNNIFRFIYDADFMSVWIVAFFALIGLFTQSLFRFMKLQGELQCSYV